jgi:hypothetical protein
MKSHFVTPILLLVAMLPAGLSARLGDNELQCETRYGKPVAVPASSLSTAPYTRRYKFDGWIIEATFVNRRVARQSYSYDWSVKHTEAASASYPEILQAEAGDGKWQSYVIGSPGDYQDGIIPSASRWQNTNGRIAYTTFAGELVVEETGYRASQTPKASPKKRTNF